MDLFLPPFGKRHIIIFGSITLFLSIYLIWQMSLSQNPSSNTYETIVKSTTASSITEEFKDDFANVQSDKAEAAWILDGFVVLDIRTNEEYSIKHIKGSKSTPVEYLHLASFNPDVDMVVYSDEQSEIDQAVEILKSKNIRNVHTLHDNLNNLEAAGYQMSGEGNE